MKKQEFKVVDAVPPKAKNPTKNKYRKQGLVRGKQFNPDDIDDVAVEIANVEARPPTIRRGSGLTHMEHRESVTMAVPKENETPDQFAERRIQEMVVPAIQEVEYNLMYGTNKTRMEMAQDILERRGFARNDQRVKSQLSAPPVVLVIGAHDSATLGFLGGRARELLQPVKPQEVSEQVVDGNIVTTQLPTQPSKSGNNGEEQ